MHKLYHNSLKCLAVIAILALGACHQTSKVVQDITPNMEWMKEKKAAEVKPVTPPPPSPIAAQDQANLPKGTRSLKDTVLEPINTQVNIALLLPLSGPNARLGRDLLDAAQLALFDVKNPELKLIPLDTQATAGGAIAAMNQAIANKASIVVGPLFSHEALAIAPIAKTHNIEVISFSNDAKVAEAEAFTFGFMPDQQVKRVLEYALRKGIRDFYVIAPSDALGKASVAVLEKLKEERGDFNIRYTGTYNTATNQGMVEAARTVANQVLAARKTEGTDKARGLLFPEGGSKLMEISKLISGFGLNANDIRLLGSGQWDDPQIQKFPRLYGSWFASASPTQRDIFVQHFQKTFGYEPVRIASISYDSVALIGFIAKMSGNRLSTGAIINERGFAGVDGVFRFSPGRVSERSLAVLEVIPNGFEIVDEAPKALTPYSAEKR